MVDSVYIREFRMPDPRERQSPQEVEELTTAIREMASRVSAEFVLDQEKAQNFIKASEHRNKSAGHQPD
jgi:hypothetical protein